MKKALAFCQLCGNTDVTLRCSKCKRVYYCKDTSCQRDDWPQHKKCCGITPTAELEQKSIESGAFSLRFLNPRQDRTLAKHGADTHETTLNSGVLAFIKLMGLDPARAAMMRICPDIVCGGYGRCYLNVSLIVKSQGGEIVHGWSIFEGSHVIEAEQHTVWVPPVASRQFVNVTKVYDRDRAACTVFVPDKKCEYHCLTSTKPLPNIVYWKR